MPRPIDLSVYSSETLEIEIRGTIYVGMRFFTGADPVRQEVHFLDLRQIDPRPHRGRDVAQMRRTARVILRDLVERWREQDVRRPVKVEPRAKRTRRRSSR